MNSECEKNSGPGIEVINSCVIICFGGGRGLRVCTGTLNPGILPYIFKSKQCRTPKHGIPVYNVISHHVILCHITG